jgi:hypothetical protein
MAAANQSKAIYEEVYGSSGLSFVEEDSDSLCLKDLSTHYVLNGQVTERPASPVTISGFTLHDVPAGSTVWCDDQGYPAEGDVELEFPLPGTYQVRVECFPYLDWTAEVIV